MRKPIFLFIMLVLFAVMTFQCAVAAEQARPRVVVMPFDDQSNYVRGLSEALCTQFSTDLRSSGRFDIYERRLLDKILKEHNIELSGLVDPATAVRIGKMTGCQLVAMGTIMDVKCETGKSESILDNFISKNKYTTNYETTAEVTINYEVVDVETGEIWQMSTEKESERKTGTTYDRESLIKKAAFKTSATFVKQRMHPMVKGKVVRVDADRFIINIGSSQGVSTNTEFKIVTQGKPVTDPDTGKVIGYEQGSSILAHPIKDGIQPGMCYAVTGYWKKTNKVLSSYWEWREDPDGLKSIAVGAIVATGQPEHADE